MIHNEDLDMIGWNYIISYNLCIYLAYVDNASPDDIRVEYD